MSISKTLLALLIFSASIFGESEESASYQQKIQRYTNMQIGGIALMVGGVSALAAGIAMISSAGTASYEVTYSDGERTESGDPRGGLGAVIAGFGVPMTVGGIVLTTIGSKRKREHKNGLSTIQIDVGFDRLTVTCRF